MLTRLINRAVNKKDLLQRLYLLTNTELNPRKFTVSELWFIYQMAKNGVHIHHILYEFETFRKSGNIWDIELKNNQ